MEKRQIQKLSSRCFGGDCSKIASTCASLGSSLPHTARYSNAIGYIRSIEWQFEGACPGQNEIDECSLQRCQNERSRNQIGALQNQTVRYRAHKKRLRCQWRMVDLHFVRGSQTRHPRRLVKTEKVWTKHFQTVTRLRLFIGQRAPRLWLCRSNPLEKSKQVPASGIWNDANGGGLENSQA